MRDQGTSRWRRAALLGAALLLLAGPAGAAPTAAERAAEDAFHQGREAMKRGDFAAALPLLRESQRLFPVPGTLLNLAVTEQKLGMIASARRHLEEVVGLLPAGDARIAFARKEAEGLAPRVPRLRVVLPARAGAAAALQVTLDDAPLTADRLGAEIPVDPGRHLITAAAPGEAPRRYEAVAVEGALVEVPVELAGSAPPPGPSSGRRTAGFVTLGVGVAALGAGMATGILALVKHGQLEAPSGACVAAGTCGSLASTGKALSWTSTATLAVGAAGAAVGLYLVLSGPRVEAARPAAVVRLAPAFRLAAGLAPRAGGGTIELGGAY